MIKPMLAATVDVKNRGFKDVQFPVYASAKIDGVRAIVINGVVMSRNGIAIPNVFVQEQFGRKALEGLDGELIVGEPSGDGVFNRTTSGVMSSAGKPNVVFHVFDDVTFPGTFAERYREVMARVVKLSHQRVQFVPHDLIDTQEILQDVADVALAAGYEGLCLRSPEGRYKQGRSTLREQGLMKIKPFEDSEAVVLDSVEALTNTNGKGNAGRRTTHKAGMVSKGTLGKLHVRDLHTGVEFMLGCGKMTAAEAQELWNSRNTLPGRVAKYKYQKVGTMDRPRQPIFLGFRHTIDTPKPRRASK